MQNLLYSGALHYTLCSFGYGLCELAPCSIDQLGHSGVFGFELGVSTTVYLLGLMGQRTRSCIHDNAS